MQVQIIASIVVAIGLLMFIYFSYLAVSVQNKVEHHLLHVKKKKMERVQIGHINF